MFFSFRKRKSGHTEEGALRREIGNIPADLHTARSRFAYHNTPPKDTSWIISRLVNAVGVSELSVRPRMRNTNERTYPRTQRAIERGGGARRRARARRNKRARPTLKPVGAAFRRRGIRRFILQQWAVARGRRGGGGGVRDRISSRVTAKFHSPADP
jgi:hypothetical protein